ncbi:MULTISPECIES: vitamin B12-dependent ribonucleotide reductase [unclassified Saccharibacter]|uniref:TSCPD domain-containing protein n=1 Tax=unclassified Saccharibacter TaxID=2648722 RepID=UPI00132A15D9|nr:MULTISPECIES: vitamin B12-dependent ribonucleotide reductase [unclassified Saccharibacter]MXV36367.1 vitamin B12-dependent ribonucleotide reductase [Saccharibacter sp. EH611]MXV57529.1 vitamin B12-dependent ribonucleotide reductase [Saccharibacter sp. EH70]MXV65164.1 vitamin B12-dependent ribonucleotide reductase [Saccharibacter sp. EH60]
MKAHLHWNGVRMRTLQISTDPDSAALRSVTLPSAWGDNAAQALTQLTPTCGGPLRLSTEAARWVDMIDATPPLPGTPKETPSPGRSLSCLLLMQHMAPNLALWRRQPDEQPGFVVRLSGFVQENCFSPEHFVACLTLACDSLRRLDAAQQAEQSGELPLFDDTPPYTASHHPAGIVLLTDLDACLAAIGLDYDSDEGRQMARAITGLARIVARAGTKEPAPLFSTPNFPEFERVAVSVSTAAAAHSDRAPVETGFSSPGPSDALLEVEACGLAPIFSLLDDEGHLRPSTLNRLAHRGLTPEKALALALGGTQPLPLTNSQGHARMQDALSGLCDYLPQRPEPETEATMSRLERGVRRHLPMRQGGFTQRASIGGHRLFMRTSEFEDGSLGALALSPPRESPMARGLMECLGQAVSIGLQFGAPLEAFVDQFSYTRFGPGGTVEGDPVATYATSMLDYAFRALSEAYLGQHMPDAPIDNSTEDDGPPMLPFGGEETPANGKTSTKRRLRLVG